MAGSTSTDKTAGTTSTATASTASRTGVVKYIGTADERVILKSDWSDIDVKDQEAVKWNAANGYAVPFDKFTDSALEYLDKKDSGFVLVEDQKDS